MYEVNMCLLPREGHTGCGIIVDVVDTHPKIKELGYTNKSYVVMTDFGNTFILTGEEMNRIYKPYRVETNPEERALRQLELLKYNFKKYYNLEV